MRSSSFCPRKCLRASGLYWGDGVEVYLAPVRPEERDRERDRDVLYRLLQYSLYEESAFDGNEMDETARFAYPGFDAWLTSPDREACLIRSHEGGTW